LVPGSGFWVQPCRWPQATTLIEKETVPIWRCFIRGLKGSGFWVQRFQSQKSQIPSTKLQRNPKFFTLWNSVSSVILSHMFPENRYSVSFFVFLIIPQGKYPMTQTGLTF
jgi:hypothetical protein